MTHSILGLLNYKRSKWMKISVTTGSIKRGALFLAEKEQRDTRFVLLLEDMLEEQWEVLISQLHLLFYSFFLLLWTSMKDIN